MSFNKITYEVSDDIATIAFNDPNTMNAAGTDTIEELSLALEQAGDDARCTILTGNGRGFCSGANLSSDPADQPVGKPDAGKGLDTHYNPFIKAMRTHPHPIITVLRCNGGAIVNSNPLSETIAVDGIGLDLKLIPVIPACDLRGVRAECSHSAGG